jgi:hypothetical protein
MEDQDRINALITKLSGKVPTQADKEQALRLIASSPRLQAVEAARADRLTLEDLELLVGFGIIELTAAQRIG